MWGALIGGALGLMGSSKQAKAQDNATAAQMAGFNQYKPYVDAQRWRGRSRWCLEHRCLRWSNTRWP